MLRWYGPPRRKASFTQHTLNYNTQQSPPPKIPRYLCVCSVLSYGGFCCGSASSIRTTGPAVGWLCMGPVTKSLFKSSRHVLDERESALSTSMLSIACLSNQQGATESTASEIRAEDERNQWSSLTVSEQQIQHIHEPNHGL